MQEYQHPIGQEDYDARLARIKETDEALAKNARNFPKFFPKRPKSSQAESDIVQMAVHGQTVGIEF